MNRPRKPGVFEAGGQMVAAAAYRRGLPSLHLPLEDDGTLCLGPHAELAPGGFRYFYVGHLTGHYGHFLFSILARLWNLPMPLPRDVKLVALNGFRIDQMVGMDFARAIFQSLGISADSFARITRPTRFAELFVPEPAAEENIGGHGEFVQLCHWIGDKIAPINDRRDGRPKYLTRRNLQSGVVRIVNEDLLCAALSQRGFEIISPELLKFPQQISLWRNQSPIVGISGSSMHTSIFASGRRYAALSTEAWINSNQTIIDLLNGNEGTILYPDEDCKRLPPTAQFETEILLSDPDGAAESLASVSRQ